jgi:hypothetical protein
MVWASCSLIFPPRMPAFSNMILHQLSWAVSGEPKTRFIMLVSFVPNLPHLALAMMVW